LPGIKIYYAVKANSEREIIDTLFNMGTGFDVASIQEFKLVIDVVRKHLPLSETQKYVWDKIIYANPVKPASSLRELDLYKPLVTYDCPEEIDKIKKHCPNAGVLLRLKVSNQGSTVQLSNKFGVDPKDALGLIAKTIKMGVGIEGLSFHVGSQCLNPESYTKALRTCAQILRAAKKDGYEIGEKVTKGYPISLIDIGGGFPVKYSQEKITFPSLAKSINKEIGRLFPKDSTDILAEPGRFVVAESATLISRVILAKHEGRTIPSYHIEDGMYGTYSGAMYDHFVPSFFSPKKGRTKPSLVFGPTCDGIDAVAGGNPYLPQLLPARLPILKEDDFICTPNIGAYSIASATEFNGMPRAKIIHINKIVDRA